MAKKFVTVVLPGVLVIASIMYGLATMGGDTKTAYAAPPTGGSEMQIDAIPGGAVDLVRNVLVGSSFTVYVTLQNDPAYSFSGYQIVANWDAGDLTVTDGDDLGASGAGFPVGPTLDNVNGDITFAFADFPVSLQSFGTPTAIFDIDFTCSAAPSSTVVDLLNPGQNGGIGTKVDPGGQVEAGANTLLSHGMDITINCEAATATPTNTPVPPTNTATNTPVPPTATPTPAGPTIHKEPSPSNLWLCDEDPPLDNLGECDDNGEGGLIINEILNVPSAFQDNDGVGGDDGLGAFEFQVKFDHKIFTIDINSTGFMETNGRLENCSNEIITENWVLFGCVTTDPTPLPLPISEGPNAPIVNAIIATVTLLPNEDLVSRLHPGNDNGVTRLILDENCEVADIFGHPHPGSIGGGLTLTCGDASVTVRILEGDLNLDCTVDGDDAQQLAFRYGTFFGNIFYDPWYDMEPALKDFDIDIKDLQKVFGRIGSTCELPIPPQPPVQGLSVGPL